MTVKELYEMCVEMSMENRELEIWEDDELGGNRPVKKEDISFNNNKVQL